MRLNVGMIEESEIIEQILKEIKKIIYNLNGRRFKITVTSIDPDTEGTMQFECLQKEFIFKIILTNEKEIIINKEQTPFWKKPKIKCTSIFDLKCKIISNDSFTTNNLPSLKDISIINNTVSWNIPIIYITTITTENLSIDEQTQILLLSIEENKNILINSFIEIFKIYERNQRFIEIEKHKQEIIFNHSKDNLLLAAK